MAAEFGLSLLLGLANGVLMFLLALFVAFFFFASGDRLAGQAPRTARPHRRRRGRRG